MCKERLLALFAAQIDAETRALLYQCILIILNQAFPYSFKLGCSCPVVTYLLETEKNKQGLYMFRVTYIECESQ